MNIPGFAAEASLNRRSKSYPMIGTHSGRAHADVILAGSCTCTDPNCTWSCPPPPPPDCTTTGCPQGRICCDCIDPPICIGQALCRRLCLLGG
jgi:hypothetical protein